MCQRARQFSEDIESGPRRERSRAAELAAARLCYRAQLRRSRHETTTEGGGVRRASYCFVRADLALCVGVKSQTPTAHRVRCSYTRSQSLASCGAWCAFERLNDYL